MQHKPFTIILSLAIGLLVGWVAWGRAPSTPSSHVMPDGTVMSNDGSSMAMMMHDMNAALNGKSGDAFDQAFISEMIVHHQGAIDMAALALTSAKHSELKDLANDIITAQTSEIAQMKQWQKDWYNK